MKQAKIMCEKTPLTEADCLSVFSRIKKEFKFPLHTHDVFELNFIQNGKGAQRIVGDNIECIEDLELTFITSADLEHAWFTHNCTSKQIKEITIQFHKDLISDTLLKKNSFKTISKLISDANRGVTFGKETIEKVKFKLELLAQHSGSFDAIPQLLTILHELSISNEARILASSSINGHFAQFESRRIDKIYSYMEENYTKDIKLKDAADLVKMSEVALCKFLKKRTGRTLIEALNEIRLGHAVRMLINTTATVSEICYACGFNNLSYFNRLFLREKKCTPSKFRVNYKKNRVVI